MTTDDQGRYAFETMFPGLYLNGSLFRAPHIHYRLLREILRFNAAAGAGPFAAASCSASTTLERSSSIATARVSAAVPILPSMRFPSRARMDATIFAPFGDISSRPGSSPV